jgi:hypothetical protein
MIKLTLAYEFTCPNCNKIGFCESVPYIRYPKKDLFYRPWTEEEKERAKKAGVVLTDPVRPEKDPTLMCPHWVTCIHCNHTVGTKERWIENDIPNTVEFMDSLVDLQLAWKFICESCEKKSFSSFVPYKPPLESEVYFKQEEGEEWKEPAKIKITCGEFKEPEDVICQHCGFENLVEKSLKLG